MRGDVRSVYHAWMYGSAMEFGTDGLLRWSGVCAVIGAAMWAYKSIVILVTGDQPDYWFELALVWSGLSVLALIYALRGRLNRSAALPFLSAGSPR